MCYLGKLESCNQVGLAVLFSLPRMGGPIFGLPSALGPAVGSPGVIAATCLPIISCSAGVGIPGSRSALLPSVSASIAGAARFRTAGPVLVPRSRSLLRTSVLLCALLGCRGKDFVQMQGQGFIKCFLEEEGRVEVVEWLRQSCLNLRVCKGSP